MGAVPSERFAIEAPMLGPLPHRRFDTAYVEPRRVHVAIPEIEWRGVRYSVPVRCLGQKVEVRQEVGSSAIEIRWACELPAAHTVGDAGPVWDPGHYEEAQAAALGRCQENPSGSCNPRDSAGTSHFSRLEIEGDVDVEVPDLARYSTEKAMS